MAIYPNVAGMFYPADPERLRQVIYQYLAKATSKNNPEIPKAIIVPHAGYVYSGVVAASAYNCFTQARNKIKHVVVFAPAHRYSLRGIATTQAEIFITSLGEIKIEQTIVKSVTKLPQISIIDEAFMGEHAIEVQLPFLQTVLDNFSLIPFLVGYATPQSVATVLEKVWGNDETLIVISSDLSHYNNYEAAKIIDGKTSDDILAFNHQNIESEQACGSIAIRGLLITAAQKKLRAVCLDLRNSGDTAGTKESVVGYGAFHFYHE